MSANPPPPPLTPDEIAELEGTLSHCQRILAHLSRPDADASGPSIVNAWAECVRAESRARAASTDALPRLLSELTRLRAIVDKLPVTADGVPIVPGMKVWKLADGNFGEAYGEVVAGIYPVAGDMCVGNTGWEALPGEVYSTRDAAIASCPSLGAASAGANETEKQ